MAGPDPGLAARVREHLQAQGKRDWPDVWLGVMERRFEVLRAIDDLSEAQAAWRAEGEWSIRDIVRHLSASTDGVVRIVEDLAHGRPVLDGRYDEAPGGLIAHEHAPPGDETFAEVRREFVAGSATFSSVRARIPAEPDKEATFPHMYYGPLNCCEWFAFQAIHDGDHLRGIGNMRSAPGFPAA